MNNMSERQHSRDLEAADHAAEMLDEVSDRMEKAVIASLQGSSEGFEYVPTQPIGLPLDVSTQGWLDVFDQTLAAPEVIDAFHELMRHPAAAKFCAAFAADVVKQEAPEVADVLLESGCDD